MKVLNWLNIQLAQLEDFQTIWAQLYQKKTTRYLLLTLSLNLVVAPAVQAATGGAFSRPQAYAIGLLGLATVIFSMYLFVVMFQPERF